MPTIGGYHCRHITIMPPPVPLLTIRALDSVANPTIQKEQALCLDSIYSLLHCINPCS